MGHGHLACFCNASCMWWVLLFIFTMYAVVHSPKTSFVAHCEASLQAKLHRVWCGDLWRECAHRGSLWRQRQCCRLGNPFLRYVKRHEITPKSSWKNTLLINFWKFGTVMLAWCFDDFRSFSISIWGFTTFSSQPFNNIITFQKVYLSTKPTTLSVLSGTPSKRQSHKGA